MGKGKILGPVYLDIVNCLPMGEINSLKSSIAILKLFLRIWKDTKSRFIVVSTFDYNN